MKINNQSGFSLIELLLVITIIGIIAAFGIPSFQKGIKAADNGAAYATLRTISTAQVSYFSQNSRFGRLSELNAIQTNGFGIPSGSGLIKGRFVYEMSPLTPTNIELRDSYVITASGINGSDGTPYVYRVTQTGEIIQVTP
ncbi:MAG: prepilin-type N-terminal cleavage/methylation domain-containing protein [Actinomycetota bacterium]